MKYFSTFVALFFSYVIFQYHCNAQPIDKTSGAGIAAVGIIIDSAPSVVSYQGSSKTHAHLVLAPMGRSLGYVEPVDVNRTLARNERLAERNEVLLDINPVYVPK